MLNFLLSIRFLMACSCYCWYQITRLLPDAEGTTCTQRLEKVFGTEYAHILRVPFRDEKGIVRKWISRFEVWPYLENYTEVIPSPLLSWDLISLVPTSSIVY